jgi:hypothetical protein
MLTQLVKAAASPFPEFEYVGKVFTTSPSSPSHTFSSVALGSAEAKLLVILVNSTGGGNATVTVGGQPTIKQVQENTASPNSTIFTIDSITASTGNIVVTRTGSITALTVFVYAVYGSGYTVTPESTNESPFTFVNTFVGGEIFIGLGRYVSTTTATFTNATTDDSSVLAGFTAAQVASYISPSVLTRTITFTPVNDSSAWLVNVTIT